MPTGGGRRGRRRADVEQPRLAPLAAWAGFAVVVTAGALALVGVPLATVGWLVAVAVLLGGVLVAAAALSPPAPLPPATPGDEDAADGGDTGQGTTAQDPSAP